MSVPLIVLAVVLLILDILLRRFPEIIDKAAMALIRLKPKKKPKEIFAEKKNANKPTEEEKIIKDDKQKPSDDVKSSSSKLADIKRNRRKS